MTQKQIKNSLIKQLTLQGKTSEFYKDLIEDHVYYWTLKKKLIPVLRKKDTVKKE